MEKKTPEEKVREKLNSLKEKISRGKEDKRVRRAVIIALACLLLLVTFVVLMLTVKIKNINVTGGLRAYNETRVAQASGIDIGKSLLSKSGFAIKRSIRKNIPLADEIRVRKNIFTGEVNIEITFLPFDYYIQYKDAYYALDENLVVVDVRKSESDFASLGGTLIKIPKTCRPVFGEELVFYDTVPNPDGEMENPVSEEYLTDKEAYDYIYDALASFKASENYPTLTRLDLTEGYEIVAVYDESFKVSIGSVASLDLKLQILSNIIADTSWQHSEFGVIDLTNPSAATARAVQSISEDSAETDGEAN